MEGPASAATIDDVLAELDRIVRDSELQSNPLGYFAVLYRRVTEAVKQGIEQGDFEDGPRMELLDVVFARRYLDAYQRYQSGHPPTASWLGAFERSTHDRMIVLQHLLLGINAHINLDLGIAAVEISHGSDLNRLQRDFNKINDILASLVGEVQDNLATIWPPLRWILRRTGQLDNLLVDFSMQLARDGAWGFAQQLDRQQKNEWANLIADRDRRVAGKTSLIVPTSRWLQWLFFIIRLGEVGSVGLKIRKLDRQRNPQMNT